MAITVFTVYILTLTALVWAEVVESVTGFLVAVLVLGVSVVVVAAAGHLEDR